MKPFKKDDPLCTNVEVSIRKIFKHSIRAENFIRRILEYFNKRIFEESVKEILQDFVKRILGHSVKEILQDSVKRILEDP